MGSRDAVDVFISYSREPEDQAAARTVFDLVREANLRPWMDTNLNPSDDFRHEIFLTISRVSVLLYLITPASARDDPSNYCRKEVLYALNEARKPVIPCKLAPAALPPGLAGELILLQRLDLSRLEPSDWAPTLYDALEAVGLQPVRPPGMVRRASAPFPVGVRPLYRELRSASSANVQSHLDRYAAALRAEPGYGWGQLNLGLLFLSMGQREQAVQRLEQAVHLMASDARPRYFTALALAAGKPLRYQRADVIAKIESNLNEARSLDQENGLPDLLDAIVLAEHYRPNSIRRPRSLGVAELLAAGYAKSVDHDELERLLDTVVISDPGLVTRLAPSR